MYLLDILETIKRKRPVILYLKCIFFISFWRSNPRGLKSNVSILESVLSQIGPKQLYFMCGFRVTKGSIIIDFPSDHVILPPSRDELISVCCTPHKNSLLTVCGRALTKHHARDSSKSFWNSVKGNEHDKNTNGLRAVNRILNEATWSNIHEISGRHLVLEVRTHLGYGARWKLLPELEFRGFVEPMHKANPKFQYRH
ncbi:hypothetical protein GEMRC1_012433 [Eukaryota sp. GEM-RC1]